MRNWDRIKREVEGRGAGDPFADMPENLPALLYARKILRRADPEGGAPADRATPRRRRGGGSATMLLEAVRRVALGWASIPSSPCAPRRDRLRDASR